MQDRTFLIQSDKLYKPSEVANPSELNPRGLGLLDMHYITLGRKIKNNEFPLHEDKRTAGGYRRIYIKGDILIRYTKYGSKIFVT